MKLKKKNKIKAMNLIHQKMRNSNHNNNNSHRNRLG